MKKIAMVALVAILTIGTVFAGGLFKSSKGPEFAVGLTAGFAQDILMKEDVNVSSNQIPLMINGIVDITKNFAVGTNFGLSINLPNDSRIQETKAGFAADVLAYYVLPATNTLNVYLGGGFSYDYLNVVNTEALKNSMHTLAIDLDAKAAYAVTDNVEILGGLNLAFDVLKSFTAKTPLGNGSSDNLMENVFGLQWGINVGAAYKF